MRIKLIILLLFSEMSLFALCKKSFEMYGITYCILTFPDTAIFEMKKSTFVSREFPYPIYGKLDAGRYVILNKSSGKILMFFQIYQDGFVDGPVFWFRRDKFGRLKFYSEISGKKEQYRQPLNKTHFPLQLFNFSSKEYKEMNRKILKIYPLENK